MHNTQHEDTQACARFNVAAGYPSSRIDEEGCRLSLPLWTYSLLR